MVGEPEAHEDGELVLDEAVFSGSGSGSGSGKPLRVSRTRTRTMVESQLPSTLRESSV